MLFSQQGDQQEVLSLLDSEACDIHVCDDRGYNAAHWAACNDDAGVMHLLLSRHPKLAATITHRHMTPLHIAIMNNARTVVSYLLEDCPEEHRPDINAVNTWGETALHLAAVSGLADLAGILVTHGANASAVDQWGRTPLKVAVEHGERAVYDVLGHAEDAAAITAEEVALSDPISRDIRRRIHAELMATNLIRASLRKVEPVVVKTIFKSAADTQGSGADKTSSISAPMMLKKWKPLSQQLEYPGDIITFNKMLLQPDLYDFARRDMFGLAAIHKLAAWNKPEFLDALCPLLGNSDINIWGGDNKFHCLHYCVEMGAHQSLKYLLENPNVRDRVDVSICDGKGRTAMDLALQLKDEISVEMLAKHC